jgi:hypothetical protein
VGYFISIRAFGYAVGLTEFQFIPDADTESIAFAAISGVILLAAGATITVALEYCV